MKKILATLLVATMLLSCISVISFAAERDLYTAEVFPYAALGEMDTEEEVLVDPVAQVYLDNYRSVTGKKASEAKATPIYGVLNTANTDVESAEAPTSVTPDDIVVFPIYTNGLTSVTVNIKYDADVLTPNYETLTTDAMKMISDDDGEVKIQASSGTAGDITGFYGAVIFTVNEGLVGDTEGNATTNITILPDNAIIATGKEVSGQLGTPATMTVKLSGLEKGAAVELPEATTDKLAAAVEFTGEVSADSFAQIPAAQIVSGDSVVYDYNTHGDYRIFFGKFVDATYKQPTAQGFVIEGGKETVKAAAKTTFKAGEPFGILVFGMGAQTELTATPFIEY